MKTKHILTALALPAMFAACTADDIEGLNNGMQQTPERALLSEDFVLNIENGVESRYQVNGTTGLEFVFEASDSIGANLIDAPVIGEKDPAGWLILPYVSPAYPFVNDGADQWKSVGRLGVGNYLFTNPYNSEDGNRLAAKFELPVVVQYDSKNPNAHIAKYNKAVAADILYEGQLAANTSLKNIYTYPKIRIKFNKAYEVSKITKIVLANEDGAEFIYKGGLDHYNIVEMFKEDNIEKWLEENKEDNVTKADYWAQFETTDFILDGKYKGGIAERSGDLEYGDSKTTPYFIYEMNEAVVANTFEVRLMLPSIADFYNYGTEYAGKHIIMYICTDKGNYKFNLTDYRNYEFNKATVNSKIAKALTRNASNTLTTSENALTTATEGELFFDNIVSTVEDWNLLVAKYGNLKKYAADTKVGDREYFKVNIIDTDFAFNEETKMPEVAEFIVLTDANVEGNVTLKNIKLERTLKETNAGSGPFEIVKTPKLTVKEGATLTTDQTFIAPVVNVEKDANLVFTAAYDTKKKLTAYTGIEKVTNLGTVNVPEGVIAEFELDNNAKEAVLNVGEETAEARATETTEATANLFGCNDGIINNYGIINVIEKASGVTSFTNCGPTEGESGHGYKWDTKELAWDAAPTINNYGTFNAKGKTVNNGYFKNDGVLSSNFVGEAYFYNGTTYTNKPAKHYTAVLSVGENATTYIDENTDGAEIILAKLEPANFTIFKGREAGAYGTANLGIIKYILNDKLSNEVDLKDSPVTYLVSNVGVTLKTSYDYMASSTATVASVAKLPVLEVNGGIVKISTTKNTATNPVYVAQVAKMIVNGEVNIDGEISSVDAIEISANSKLGVPAGAKLNIGNLTNVTTLAGKNSDDKVGVLAVNGSLHLTSQDVANADKTYAGTLETETGVGTYYNVGNVAEPIKVYVNLNKGVSISVDEKAAAGNGDVDEYTLTYRSENLYTFTQTEDYKNVDGNDTYSLIIGSSLAMDGKFTVSNAEKTNADYATVLTAATSVTLKADLTGLKEGTAVTTLNELIVDGDVTISGSKNVNILKVKKLTVTAGSNLNIVGGYLVIDEVAVEGKGSEKINIEGVYNSRIIAYNSDDEMLYWDNADSAWTKDASFVQDFSEATLNVSTAESLAGAVADGVGTIVLTGNIQMTETLVFTAPATDLSSRSGDLYEITLNLDGKTLENDKGTVIRVNSGVRLTITGNGAVWGAKTNNASSQAVMANGGHVVIETGTFKVGGDANDTDRNDCIYAINGGNIRIEGGEFEYTGNVSENNQNGQKDGNKFLLNLKDDTEANGEMGDNNVITVAGGKFWRFNPAAHTTEPAETGKTSYLQLDPAVYSYATQVYENGLGPEHKSVNAYQYSWGECYFTVK